LLLFLFTFNYILHILDWRKSVLRIFIIKFKQKINIYNNLFSEQYIDRLDLQLVYMVNKYISVWRNCYKYRFFV